MRRLLDIKRIRESTNVSDRHSHFRTVHSPCKSDRCTVGRDSRYILLQADFRSGSSPAPPSNPLLLTVGLPKGGDLCIKLI